jgi:hypothetical protein
MLKHKMMHIVTRLWCNVTIDSSALHCQP